ncbi:hypothetical protein CLOSYM_04316 [[Clostridium] symbiosum ATCC 14940]|uniref:Uncharacterized protein n=1 Tax=[Clostridium] symbiosum ATCC 14940 TaxID=411472 RepID=A0ABC9TRR7_CLOSY|nr:hypothetical protein CLOSYM_04316 [[Clostridium] symbiosum ATCC 14940]
MEYLLREYRCFFLVTIIFLQDFIEESHVDHSNSEIFSKHILKSFSAKVISFSKSSITHSASIK